MATLVLNPTDPSTIPSATDLEPDERWKSRLKVDIENNLRSMVDEATQNLNNTLTKAAVSAVERERLTEEHLVTMKSIRNIAQEQFRIALEHGRQERRYAASQTLDLDWSEAALSSSLQPTVGASESHTFGNTPEYATWIPREPMEIEHERGYLPRLEPEDDHVLPRDIGKGRAGSVRNRVHSYKLPSMLDMTDRGLECSKPSITIDEPEDMHESTRSGTDAQDWESLRHRASLSSRSIPPEFRLPSTPDEGAQISRAFTIMRRGSAASTTSSYWAPSVLNILSSTEPRESPFPSHWSSRDRISTLEQEWSAIYRARDSRRTTSYTYTEASTSASTFQRLDERYSPPPLSYSVAHSPRSTVPAVGYFHSSDSLSSTVPIGYSRSSDSSYPQIPPRSASRLIPAKKFFLGGDSFQSSPSPKDWDGLLCSPCEIHYELSHSPQTPDEVLSTSQSSNLRARPSSQDLRYGYYHAQPVHTYAEDLSDSDWWEYDERKIRQRGESFRRREEEVSRREQELKRREGVQRDEEAKQKEDELRREEQTAERVDDDIMCEELEIRRREDETKTKEGEVEGEVMWKEILVREKEEIRRKEAHDEKKAEDYIRQEDLAVVRLEEEQRRVTQDILRKSEEAKRKEDEVRLKEEASRAKEEELDRREEELLRREAEVIRIYDVQEEEFRNREDATEPSRATLPRLISNRTSERNMLAANPPTNRGRSKSISTSRSNSTWIFSTRLSSSSLRSSTQRPSAQKDPPRQMSISSSVGPWLVPDRNEPHIPPMDRGRTSTSHNNTNWNSSSRLSSAASSRPSSTSKPQTPSAQKNPPRLMSTSRSSSSSRGLWPSPSRSELHFPAANPPTNRGRSESTSTSRSSTTWTSSTRLTSTASSLKIQTISASRPILNLHTSASPPTHKSRSKSISANCRNTTRTSSTRPSSSSQPHSTHKPQTPSPRHDDKVAPGPLSSPILELEWKEEEDARKDAQAIEARERAEDLEREEEEKRIARDLFPRLPEAGRMEDKVRCNEEEIRLKGFKAMYVKEEEIQLARGKECNSVTFYHGDTTQHHAQSLLNTSTSLSETTATEEEASQEIPDSALDSLEDLTNELQGRSQYPTKCGGFGDIWKCELVTSSGSVPVAAKTIRAFESDNEELTRKNGKRVRRELKVWGRLKHDSILPLWGVANDFGPHPAMICPWADNGALTSFLERQQDVLSAQDKFSLLSDIALGLQYLHSESVVHGDLTGSNVLIYRNGRACLADFGLSTIIREFIGTSYFTSTIRGNIRWAAAELFVEDDGVTLTTECDIYSFGSITLQILTCMVPYYNVKKDVAVLRQVIEGKKPEPPKDSQIAPGHWEFIQRCWLPRASRPSVGEIVTFVGCERQALAS